jgi:hypothetical protein
MQKWQQCPAQAVKLICYPIQEKAYRNYNLSKENALMHNTFKLCRTMKYCTFTRKFTCNAITLKLFSLTMWISSATLQMLHCALCSKILMLIELRQQGKHCTES